MEMSSPTPRERAENKVAASLARADTAQAMRDLAEANAWALLDAADAIRELGPRIQGL